MDANEYQRLAVATSAAHDTPDHRTINAALGLVGEAGEVARLVGIRIDGDDVTERLLSLASLIAMAADDVKKVRYHGHVPNYLRIALTLTAIMQGTAHLGAALEQEYFHEAPDRSKVQLHQSLERDKLTKEAGDIAWYVAQLSDSLGLGLGDVMQGNIDKLRTRYPEGFTPQASRERAE